MSRTPTGSKTVVHEPRRVGAASHTTMVLAIVLTILVGFTILGGFAKAEGATQAFAIPAQALGDALAQFADETNLKLVADSTLLQGLRSPGVSGDFTPSEALDRLLAGTPVRHRFLGPDTMTVEPIPEPDPLGRLVDEASRPMPLAETEPEKPRPAKGEADASGALPEMTVTASPFDETSYNVPNATTATKTDTPIMETPVSIQVVPQQVLRDQQIVRIDDALKNVSGVRRFEAGGSGIDESFFVRGFQVDGVYLDGFRLSSQTFFGGAHELANIERIEVVKGPAGVLYGRIDPGGLINIVTKRPEFTPVYYGQQQFGFFDTYRTTAGATGPVPGLETLAYRLDFAYEQADSFIDFVDSERFFVAPVFTWNISDATRATLKLQYTQTDQVPINPLTGFGDRPPDLRRSTFIGRKDDFVDSDRFIFGLNWSHDFNGNWQVRQAYNAQIVEFDSREVFWNGGFLAPGVIDRFGFRENFFQESHSLTTELLGKFETFGLKHSTLLGWEYYDLDQERLAEFGSFESNPGLSIDLFNPVQRLEPLVFDFDASSRTFQRWHGFHVQDQIELPYNLHLLLGGRYDAAEGGFANVSGVNVNVEQDHFSPRAGLLWQMTPEWAAYGSYAESFGAENLGAADRNGNPLDPEESEQWEMGLKTELLDGQFTGTLSYFELTRTNIRTSDPDPNFAAQGFSVATGEVRHQGVELDLAGEILPGWNLIASYAFLDSEITADNNPARVGNRFRGTPPHIGNLFTTYEFQTRPLKGMKLGGGGRVVDSFRTGETDTETFTVPGHITANLLAAYEWKVGKNQRIIAQLNVENLLDKNFVEFTTEGGSGFFFGPPRTFLASVRVEF